MVPPISTPTTTILLIRHGLTYLNAEGTGIQGSGFEDDKTKLNPKGEEQAAQIGAHLAKNYPHIRVIYASTLERGMRTAEIISKCFTTPLKVEKEEGVVEVCHGKFERMNPNERTKFCIDFYEKLQAAHKAGIGRTEFCENFYKTYMSTQTETQRLKFCTDFFEKLKEAYQAGTTKEKEDVKDRFFYWIFNPLSIRTDCPRPEIQAALETIFQVFTRATAAIKRIAERHPNQTVAVATHAGVIQTLLTEAEFRAKKDNSPLPPYYSPNIRLPENCSAYKFVWNGTELTYVPPT